MKKISKDGKRIVRRELSKQEALDMFGDNEKDNNLISYRLHGSRDTITCSKEEFISKVKECINGKKYNI